MFDDVLLLGLRRNLIIRENLSIVNNQLGRSFGIWKIFGEVQKFFGNSVKSVLEKTCYSEHLKGFERESAE